MIKWGTQLSGEEIFQGDTAKEIDQPISAYWKWAFSDLRQSVLRSAFAEWMVAQILNLPLPGIRDTWGICDLKTPEGVKIEVKSSARLQHWTWNVGKLSTIQFGGLKSKLYDKKIKAFVDGKTFNSDLYVFAVQNEEEYGHWDAMDLDQWRFSIITRQQLEERNCANIGENKLRELASYNQAYNLETIAFKAKAMEMINLAAITVRDQ